MTKNFILCDVHDGVATVTLNNPPLNLVTIDLTRQLHKTLDILASDPQVRVMILTGTGDRAFCAGSDPHRIPEHDGARTGRSQQVGS